jgi:hypothetical protein
MKIDLNSINQQDFYIKERNIPGLGDFYLINPRESKHRWVESELYLRSLLVDKETLEIVSSGLSKFQNLGENEEDTKKLQEAIVFEKPIEYSSKYDGSLVIKDIIKDKVHFRTRGCHDLGDFHDLVMKVVNDKYPKLLNTELYRDYSILMEFVSPVKRVVINYPESDLVLLGVMDKSVFPPKLLGTREQVVNISSILNVPPIKYHELPHNIDEIIQTVKKWENDEGIVIRIQEENSLRLIKVKSDDYLEKHRMKFNLNTSKIREIIWEYKINNLEEFELIMELLEYDYELIALFEEFANEFILEVREMLKTIIRLQTYVYENLLEIPEKKIQVEHLKHWAEENKKTNYPWAACNSLFTLGINTLQSKVDEWYMPMILDIPRPEYQKRKKELL